MLARTAWVCDDAMITFRVVDHVLDGYGPRWNVVERVQVYTHPLWLLLLLGPSLWIDPYYGSLLLGGGLTLALVARLAHGAAARPEAVALVLLAALSSAAFVDFGTSGLENPLQHVLVVGTWAAAARSGEGARGRLAVVGLGALTIVGRLDHGLLIAWPVAAALLRRPWSDGLRASLGAAPLVAWLGFALVYYGSPLPNTALAKLGTGIPGRDLAAQGLWYLRNSLDWDPVTLAAVGAGALAGLSRRRPLEAAAALTLGLWVAYVVRVGGDHMAGRFFTPAFALGLWLLARCPLPRPVALAGLLVVGWLGDASLAVPMQSGPTHRWRTLDHGIASERGFYYRGMGLLGSDWQGGPERTSWAQDGLRAREQGRHTRVWSMIGWFGRYAGPEVHVLDPLGLTDPLLARLPSQAQRWRIGHFHRLVPPNYPAAAAIGGTLKDPALDALWQDVRLVTRGPLWTWERWRAIARLAGTGPDPRGESFCSRSCSIVGVEGIAPDPRPLTVPRHGIGLALPDPPPAWIELQADPGAWRLEVSRTSGPSPVSFEVRGGEASTVVALPDPATVRRLRLFADPPEAGRRIHWLRQGR